MTRFTFCLATVSALFTFNFILQGSGNPNLHRSGGTIAYSVQENDCPSNLMSKSRPCSNRRNIWIVNSDGFGARALTHIDVFNCFSEDPVWSPDGAQIAFHSNCPNQDISDSKVVALRRNSAGHVWIMNADGSNPRPLLNEDNPYGERYPTWSPDGRKIAFSSGRPVEANEKFGNGNVWVANSDGSGLMPLTHLGKGTRWIRIDRIAWSPDGKKVGFLSDRALDGTNALSENEVSNLWVVSAEGKALQPLTKFTEMNTYLSAPIWTSDSKRIAFFWYHHDDMYGLKDFLPGPPRYLWIMNADGSSLKPLTTLKDERFPQTSSWSLPWSPDGSKLFSVNRGNLWVMNADGSAAKVLTDSHSQYAVTGAAWSPDSKQIAYFYSDYVATQEGKQHWQDVWVANVDGPGSINLGRGVGPLSWRPSLR